MYFNLEVKILQTNLVKKHIWEKFYTKLEIILNS